MPSLSVISHFSLAHPYLIYIVLFPIAFFQGPLLAIFVGFLIRLGYMDFYASYLVLALGDFCPDTLYYYIGKWGRGKKWTARWISRLSGSNEMLTRLWKEHFRKMIIFSKEAYALSTPLLMSAGLAEVPYGKFISYAFPITLIQYLVFIAVGYLLGYSYTIAGNYATYVGWIIAIVAVIFIGIYISIQKRARKAFMDIETSRNPAEAEEKKAETK